MDFPLLVSSIHGNVSAFQLFFANNGSNRRDVNQNFTIMVVEDEEDDGKSWAWVEDDDVETTRVDVDIFGFRMDESG
ncbi:hypothetical protein TNCV_2579071 [Trichonephila clavipes]|nr:hypothetical protein TNCV_2579071 [Trichonephila clavipes]